MHCEVCPLLGERIHYCSPQWLTRPLAFKYVPSVFFKNPPVLWDGHMHTAVIVSERKTSQDKWMKWKLNAETPLVAAIWSNMQCNTCRLMLSNSPFTQCQSHHVKKRMNCVCDAFWWMVLWKSVTQSSSLPCFTLMTLFIQLFSFTLIRERIKWGDVFTKVHIKKARHWKVQQGIRHGSEVMHLK